MAGKSIKIVVGEQLKRKAVLETLELRHFGTPDHLPAVETPTVIQDELTSVDIPNPAL
jgi:hypothetical protein